MKKVFGLCVGRHEIEGVTEYIFGNTLDPLNLDSMKNTVQEKLRNVDSVTLYVTGLTVALVEVINYCLVNNVDLTLMHYDRDSNSYYPQIVAIKKEVD